MNTVNDLYMPRAKFVFDACLSRSTWLGVSAIVVKLFECALLLSTDERD